MSLSDSEIAILDAAGNSPDTTLRRQAVVMIRSKQGADLEEARRRLVASFLAQTSPSFHLIPRGEAMATEAVFVDGYDALAAATEQFTVVTVEAIAGTLAASPPSFAALRMILGLTLPEFAVAMTLHDPATAATSAKLKSFERKLPIATPKPAHIKRTSELVAAIASTALAVMNRDVLAVNPGVASVFHSKLDKRDTIDGWNSVASNAGGVPYSALLYQRYIGGVWRQVQDAYSEVKGDNLAEFPVDQLLTAAGVPFWRTPAGASGAAATAAMYHLNPGPDFVIPKDNPTLVLESKIGEDGGTVRDKASRIQAMAIAARQRGLVPCAVVDGKGWRERPAALLDVIVATEGRTYTLQTLPQLLEIPEIAGLKQAT